MIVRIEEARHGDILQADIADSSGRLLFPKGAGLTEPIIKALQQRGVMEIDVVGEMQPLNVRLLAKAREYAQKFYAGHDVTIAPGLVLLGLRTEAEARLLEMGRPPLWRGCEGPAGPAPASADLPMFCLQHFSPPELPAVARELNQVLSSPDPCTKDVADVIGRSPGLSARLLRLVNSPLYSLQGKVETLTRAVTIVGLQEIGMLASGLVMVEQFGVIPRTVVDMRSFLEHCLGCALAARTLAALTGRVDADQAFVAGLLHDLGRLYYFTAFPERSRFCIDSALKHGRPLLTEEADYFGADHCAMGMRLMDGWAMPRALSQAVAFHHDPSRADESDLPTLIHLADLLVHAMGIGCSGECGPPLVQAGCMDRVGLKSEQLEQVAAEIGEKLEAIVRAFQ